MSAMPVRGHALIVRNGGILEAPLHAKVLRMNHPPVIDGVGGGRQLRARLSRP